MLYHYTSAKLLEKIIASGKLRPSNVHKWRLLWATSLSTVDLMSAYHHEPIIARFTLHSCDFEPWTDVRSRYQQEESREAAERMEQRMLKKHGEFGGPQNWYVRYAALSADRWLRIDTRDQRWQPYGSSFGPNAVYRSWERCLGTTNVITNSGGSILAMIQRRWTLMPTPTISKWSRMKPSSTPTSEPKKKTKKIWRPNEAAAF